MSSKRHVRRKQCTGKIRHDDKTKAVAAMMGLKKHNKLRGDYSHIQTYFCRFCKGWHVGHA